MLSAECAEERFEMKGVSVAIDRAIGVKVCGQILIGFTAEIVGLGSCERDIVAMNRDDADVFVLSGWKRGFCETARITFQADILFFVRPDADVSVWNWFAGVAIRGKMSGPGRGQFL